MNPNPKSQYLKISKTLGLVCSIILSAASIQAADLHWSLGTATYNTPTAWTNNAGTVVFPGGGDNAIVNNGGTVLINPGDPNWTVNDIRAGDGGTSSGSWEQDGPTVTLNGWFRLAIGAGTTGSYLFKSGTMNNNGRLIVAEGGTAVYSQTNTTANNTVSVGGELWCGNGSTANGTINLGGNAQLSVNNWLAIGRDGSTGVFNLSGNANLRKTGTGNNLTFAGITGATANGTLNQTGGTVTNESSETWLGEDGIGTWNMNAGTNSLALLQFGRNGGSSGFFNLNAGLLSVNQITLGTGVGTLNFNGGTLRARGAAPSFMSGTAGALQAGGAIIDSQGFDIGISSILADAGGGSLTKLGAGALTLTGANSYTGPTIVSGGNLTETTASLVTSDLTLANTTGLGVNVLVANAQVSHANVTFSGAANSLKLDLSNFGNPTLAPLNVTSVLNVNGTITVNIADALPQVGQFPLIKYVSKTGAGTFALGTLPAGVSATLSNNVTSSSIDLVISSTALIRWDGRVAGGVWDINTTTNWTDFITALPAKFTTGAAVFFDDLALGTTTVDVSVNVGPGSVVVTNDLLPYTFTGVGSISGATGVTKQGTNTLTITTTNNYTGATVISGGTLSVSKLADGGVPSPIGSSSASAASVVFDGGTLSYTGPTTTIDRGYSITRSSTLNIQNDLTFNGVISPSAGGNFAKTGNGTLFVKRPGANNLSAGGGGGAYNIVNGTVVMDGSSGAQTNSITGELWTGGGTNSTGGNLILTNTTLNMSSWFTIARGTGTGGYTSTATLYNSALRSVNASMTFDGGVAGTLQTGILTMNGGSTFTNSGDSNLGESGGGTSIINMNDSSVFFSANRMQIGWHTGATGAVTVANSAKIVVNAWMSIGNEGGVGSVLVKDNGSIYCGDLNVCDVNSGVGNLTITNSAVAKGNAIFVGKGATSIGTLTQSGGIVSGQNGGGAYVEIGSAALATGTYNLNAGTLLARRIRSVNNSATSTLNFNGGALVAAADGGQGVDADFLNNLSAANILLGGLPLNTGTNNIRITQALLGDVNGDGGLTKSGTGALLLNGVNTYTNATLATAGTLGGSGTIAGPVTIQAAATLAPGDGLGTLTINNNLIIAGNVAVDVNTTNTPATNDLVVVSGTLTKTGAGTVKVSNLGPNLNVGDSFTLFSQPVVGGGAFTVSGGGAVWNNRLAIDGSIQVTSLIAPPSFTAGGVVRLPDGNISLTATGTIGGTYKLWATTNLTLTPIASTWTLISSGTVTTSPFTITDLTATNYPQRFYIFSAP